MEYFTRGFKSVLGGQADPEGGPTGAETIERLCDRVSSATLLEDRRDAVRAIKSLSKKFRLEVGTGAMSVLGGVLQKDRTDAEICGLALDALVNVMTSEPTVDEQLYDQNADLAVQFSEIFLKDEENVTTLLSLLEEYDFRVRRPTVQLLTALLHNRLMQIQQCVLVNPLGVPRLMDLLSDTREVIRNDGLLLLIHLTKGNAAIQKIVVFENAFDRLVEVLAEEGYSDGGVVAEDCLTLMHNLFNPSNINFFREGSFIQKMVPFFDFSEYTSASRPWNEQKVKNVLQMLKLVRLLVSPSNPLQSTVASQKIIQSCSLLKGLCDILMTIGIPAEILTETVNTVAEVIRGNQVNQGDFSTVNAPYSPPRPAIVVLLMSMISDKQPFSLRCAVLYCFQCYLYKNPSGQSAIISTLLPSSAEANPNNVTAGQLLCGGLFSADSFSNWCAATALSHALAGNKEQKENLLRVQLATGVGNQPVSLLQQCNSILSNGGSSAQTRVAVLSLLCNWLCSCPVAVSHLVNNGAVIPHLISSIEATCESHETIIQGLSALLIGVCLVYNKNDVEGFTADSIKRLISTRHDHEHFLSKINNVSKTEQFTAAAKHTQIYDSESNVILFDHEFTKLFKKLEVKINRALLEDDDDGEAEESIKDSAAELSYKEKIREQGEELTQLRRKCQEWEETANQSQGELERKAIELIQLRNQVAIIKEQAPVMEEQTAACEAFQAQIKELQLELMAKDRLAQSLQKEVDDLHDLTAAKEQQAKEAIAASVGQPDPENENLKSLVQDLEEKNKLLSEQYEKTHNSLSVTQASLNALTSNRDKELEEVQSQREQLKQMDLLMEKLRTLEEENVALKENLQENQVSSDSSTELISQLQKDLLLKESTFAQQRQDYEDLLVLLEDQDGKIKKFKSRLRQLGEVVLDDSTDDDSDDDLADDEDSSRGDVAITESANNGIADIDVVCLGGESLQVDDVVESCGIVAENVLPPPSQQQHGDNMIALPAEQILFEQREQQQELQEQQQQQQAQSQAQQPHEQHPPPQQQQQRQPDFTLDTAIATLDLEDTANGSPQNSNPEIELENNEVTVDPDSEVVPTQECEVVPMQECEVVPMQQCEVVPTQECEVVPTQECEVVPTQDSEVVPTQNNEVVPTQDSEVVPTQECEVVPTQECEVVPMQDSEVVPTQDNEVVPTQECEVASTPVTEVELNLEVGAVSGLGSDLLSSPGNDAILNPGNNMVLDPSSNVASPDLADTPVNDVGASAEVEPAPLLQHDLLPASDESCFQNNVDSNLQYDLELPVHHDPVPQCDLSPQVPEIPANQCEASIPQNDAPLGSQHENVEPPPKGLPTTPSHDQGLVPPSGGMSNPFQTPIESLPLDTKNVSPEHRENQVTPVERITAGPLAGLGPIMKTDIPAPKTDKLSSSPARKKVTTQQMFGSLFGAPTTSDTTGFSNDIVWT